MRAERYEELLGSLLDGVLSAEEAGELAEGLRARPELKRDLAQHLVLWEVWSQHLAPERSAEAFVAAWRTRLRAESEGADVFGNGVLAELESRDRWVPTRFLAAPSAGFWRRICAIPGLIRSWVETLGLAARRRAGVAWAAALICAGLLGLFWLAGPRSSRAMVTIHGEAVCTACVLHESHVHAPAIRVTAGGKTQIYYLDRTPAVAGLQDRFCSGPRPAVAEGTPTTAAGRLRFAARTVAFPAPPKAPDKPMPDERVLFPL
ncbi:MAG TPA: hypothetical protein VLT83_15045 [Opitutaceae bacterium]|nr:hypothetical protein [Opitutaceae bacterium]